MSSLSKVNQNISATCLNSGREEKGVKLIAVSKTWPSENLLPLINLGHTSFGENKLQELEEKAPVLPSSLQWHFIGGIQRNKVRKILKYSQWLHSVDSEKLLNAINRISEEDGHKPKVFLQVNIDREDSKGGRNPEEVKSLVELAHTLSHVDLVGLMCIPTPQVDPEDLRPSFRKLVELRDCIQEETNIPLPFLSMGMSNDYHIAIEEGATHIRVGSALFGDRDYT